MTSVIDKQYEIVLPIKFGSFSCCPLCESPINIDTQPIYLEGHRDTGSHACETHKKFIEHCIMQYQVDNCIFNLSPFITKDIKVLRSNGKLQEGWCLCKCLMYDGIGVTYLLNLNIIMIKVAKYDNNMINCCKDVVLKDLLRDNDIDPLTLNLPKNILDIIRE